MPIHNLATHPAPYVTVAELAEYWAVSRKQIHKRIEAGSLSAIRLGARLYRIRTQAALEFERRTTVSIDRQKKSDDQTLALAKSSAGGSVLPAKAGFQRIPRSE